MELRFGPKAQVRIQLDRRFPAATSAFLAGELVGHYYNEESPLDVLVLAPKDQLKDYRQEAQTVSGYKLKNSTHPVHFHVIPNDYNAAVLSDKFGLLYNLSDGAWIGRRVSDTSALADPEALLRFIRWRVFRVKNDDVPYPYRWRILPEAYMLLSDEGRQHVLSTLRDIMERMRLNARRIAGVYRDPHIWEAAGKLELMLQQDEHEDIIENYVAEHNLPPPILKAFYNMYRYKDVHDILEATERKIQKLRDVENASKGIVMQLASTKEAPDTLTLGGKIYRKLVLGTSRASQSGEQDADV